MAVEKPASVLKSDKVFFYYLTIKLIAPLSWRNIYKLISIHIYICMYMR